MTDYSKSKYGDAVAELADAIVNSGFADDTIDNCGDGFVDHYELVTIRPEAIGDELEDVWNAAARTAYLTGSRVILHTDNDGFVDVVYGPAHPEGDPAAYRALMGEWSTMLERATGETDPEADALYASIDGAPAEDDEPAGRRAYVVQAVVAGRSVPTFYLLADVQGIVSAEHARRVALDILYAARRPEDGATLAAAAYTIEVAETTL